MKLAIQLLAAVLVTTACGSNNGNKSNAGSTSGQAPETFANARKNFTTKIITRIVDGTAPDVPPKGTLNLVEYPANIGNMAAYISSIPQDGKLHPAIIWLIGGFGNSISKECWVQGEEGNDQSAAVMWKSGLVVMYPSTRGGNKNPGTDECFYGEIDDIISAAKYLAAQPGIDPKRIYLGGHSTGGTKTLLAAEVSDVFRATFSIAGVSIAPLYGMEHNTFDTTQEMEYEMRAPVLWLRSIRKPVFVLDATTGSNIDDWRRLKDSADAQHIAFAHFYEIKHGDHFTICRPLCKMITEKILADCTGATSNISFNEAELGSMVKEE